MSYFGNLAGVDWTSGSPVALTNGANSAFEGGSTICDSTSGSLKFYTNGANVYTNTHVTMPNGTGLMAGTSCSQGTLIIPKPKNGNQFYIFTAQEFCGVSGLRHSIVDMTLNSGLGDVVVASKNTALVSPVSEHLAGVKHANCRDYWVTTRGCSGAGANNFYAYLVTSTGVSAPVTTTIGMTTPAGWPGGFMKFSPNGQKAAIIHASPARVELYDFNNTTGVFSNLVTLSSTGSLYGGLEFSPNSNVLYVGLDPNGTNIYQYNLLAGSAAAIIASATFIGNVGSGYTGEVQRGLDGKIYISPFHSSQYLSVINNPNTLGVGCGLVANGFFLAGRTTQYSLQNLPASFTVATPPCVTLPVEEMYLSAQLNNHQVNVNWHLLEEQKSNYFKVERSKEGQEWETLTQIESKDGFQTIDKYSFEDKKTTLGR